MNRALSLIDVTLILSSDFSKQEFSDLLESLRNGARRYTDLPERYTSSYLSRIIGACRDERYYDHHY